MDYYIFVISFVHIHGDFITKFVPLVLLGFLWLIAIRSLLMIIFYDPILL